MKTLENNVSFYPLSAFYISVFEQFYRFIVFFEKREAFVFSKIWSTAVDNDFNVVCCDRSDTDSKSYTIYYWL